MGFFNETLEENRKNMQELISTPNVSALNKIQYSCMMHTSTVLLNIYNAMRTVKQKTLSR